LFQPDRSLSFHIPGTGAGPDRFNLDSLFLEYTPGGKVFDVDSKGRDVGSRVGKIQGSLEIRLFPGAIDPEIKVLLSSGYSLDSQATEILERGCSGFIQKPFNIKALSKKLREILDET